MKKVTRKINGKPQEVLLCHYPEDYKLILLLLKGGVNAYGSSGEVNDTFPSWDGADFWDSVLREGRFHSHSILKNLPYVYFDSSFSKKILKEIIELPS